MNKKEIMESLQVICNKYKQEIDTLINQIQIDELIDFANEQNIIKMELETFAQLNNATVNWSNKERKWCLVYDYIKDTILVQWSRDIKTNNVYFSTQEIAKKAIEVVGEDRLKKYYFEA